MNSDIVHVVALSLQTYIATATNVELKKQVEILYIHLPIIAKRKMLLLQFSAGRSVFLHVGMTWYSQIGVPSPQES